MVDQLELLRIIEKNAKLTAEEIAVMLGASAEEIRAEIATLTDNNIIVGYTTQINWEKSFPESVTAMIEVRITPVRNKGFNQLAEIISQYDKVTACYLMSGGFDLLIVYQDNNIRNIASFVYDKIATLEGVLSTATHFILKKYKDNGIIYDSSDNDDRQAIIL